MVPRRFNLSTVTRSRVPLLYSHASCKEESKQHVKRSRARHVKITNSDQAIISKRLRRTSRPLRLACASLRLKKPTAFTPYPSCKKMSSLFSHTFKTLNSFHKFSFTIINFRQDCVKNSPRPPQEKKIDRRLVLRDFRYITYKSAATVPHEYDKQTKAITRGRGLFLSQISGFTKRVTLLLRLD